MPKTDPLSRSKVSPEERGVAARLRRIRLVNGFSLQELADECGIKKGALKHYEHGMAALPLSVGNAICRRLYINQRWLALDELPETPFVEPSELGLPPIAGKRCSLREAFMSGLGERMGEWINAHPEEIEKTFWDNGRPLRNWSKKSLHNFLMDSVRAIIRHDDLKESGVRVEQLSQAVEEMKKRIASENPVDATPPLWELSPVQISELVKTKRAALGLTQTQAATKWGVPAKTLQSWEQGTRKPRGLAMRQLEQILQSAK